MNYELTQLVGTPEQVAKAEEIRAKVWPEIAKLQAPRGAVRLKSGDLSYKTVEKIRALNNAFEWAKNEPYLNRKLAEDDGEVTHVTAGFIATALERGRNLDPQQWSAEAIAQRAELRRIENERATATAQFLALPKLTGTERQVAWATTLRDKARSLAERKLATDEFEKLATSKEGKRAKFWIDNREEWQVLELLGFVPVHTEFPEGEQRRMTPAERAEFEAGRAEFAKVMADSRRKKYSRGRRF